MTIPTALGEQVRRRAQFACEYCGVTETDSGGPLTADHFRPRTCGGTDDLDNLLYCCYRCNLYKADYWPAQPAELALWNPRKEPVEVHLRPLADGTLYPITPTGKFTLQRLRLNRPQLVAYRLRSQLEGEKQRLVTKYQELLALSENVHKHLEAMLEEQRTILEEQRALLKLLLRDDE
jgi:hypothetical protein